MSLAGGQFMSVRELREYLETFKHGTIDDAPVVFQAGPEGRPWLTRADVFADDPWRPRIDGLITIRLTFGESHV